MTEAGHLSTKQRRPDWAALFIGIGLFAIAALVAFDASRLGGAASYARIGPQTVPYAIALVLAGLGLWTVIEAWRGDFPRRERQEIVPVLWIVGGLIIQMTTIRFVGFSISTGLLFAMTARGLGRVNLAFAVVVGIVLSFLVWILFARVLQLTLPAGPIEHLLLPG